MHRATDALLRLPTSWDDNTPLEDQLQLFALDMMHNLADTHICVIGATSDKVIPLGNDITGATLDMPPTESKFLIEQAQEKYCNTARKHVGCHGSEFYLDYCGLLICESVHDEATQVVLPKSLRQRVLHLSHHPPFSRHPGQRRMIDKLRQTYYCPHMAGNVYVMVAQYESCARSGSLTDTRYFYRYKLQKNLSKSVAMDILGLPPSKLWKNQYTFFITDRYFRIKRAIPTSKDTASQAASPLLDHRIVSNGVPMCLHTEKGPECEHVFSVGQ